MFEKYIRKENIEQNGDVWYCIFIFWFCTLQCLTPKEKGFACLPVASESSLHESFTFIFLDVEY